MNVVVDDRMSFSSVGNRFHAWGAATENAPYARSPNRRSVRGRKRLPLLEARSDERVGMSATCEHIGDVVWCVADECRVNEQTQLVLDPLCDG